MARNQPIILLRDRRKVAVTLRRDESDALDAEAWLEPASPRESATRARRSATKGVQDGAQRHGVDPGGLITTERDGYGVERGALSARFVTNLYPCLPPQTLLPLIL